MGLYDRLLLPRMVDFTCSRNPQMRQRQKIVPAASGRVLEIGFGSGLNVPLYDPRRVEHVWALEPSAAMWALARERIRSAPFSVEFVEAGAEDVPLDDRSVDTVLVTYVLCTVPNLGRALEEARRVLRTGGRLLFCEHGAAPDERVLRWQNVLNPFWRRISGGCNLNRVIPPLLESGGFRITELSAMYVPGWKVASYNYWGTAVAA